MPDSEHPRSSADDLGDRTPGLVMCFNINDPCGAGGLAADVASVASVGAHALPVVTGILVRDSAEVFDCFSLDADEVIDQARAVLEDATVHAFKIGHLASVEVISAVAELLTDYPDVPVVTYLGSVSHLAEAEMDDYLSAVKELLIPQSYVLIGNTSALQQVLLPDWDGNEPPTAWQLVQAAAESGCEHVLVTGIGAGDGFLENILLSPESVQVRERFERFDVSFVGAGDTLSAALAGMLTGDMELPQATAEALMFLDQSLESGFRPGMGYVVPDRLFWAQPEDTDGAAGADDDGSPPSRLQ
jgi:hydroxymethylpyrimidine/phosphomethylpyrimidine kinase